MSVPKEIPVIDYSSPQFDDLVLIDSIDTTLGKFDDLPCGTRHPDSVKFPDYVLVLKKPYPGDEKIIQRFWTADPVCEDTYTLAQQQFDGEDVAKEIFTRHYLVRRTEYIPANTPAKLSSLTGVIGVRVTAAGSGYDATTTVGFSGGAGTGVAGTPIIFRGAVVGIYLTAEGTGYTSAPDVAINGPVGAAGAAATARIQPPSAKLVQEMAERMEGQPEDGLYLKITRIYHTLPGAELVSLSAAAANKLKRNSRQKVALPYYPTASGTNVISEKVDAISTVMGWRILEQWINADGTIDNTSVPWVTHIETVEPEGVQLVTRIKTVGGATEVPPMGRDYLVTAGDMVAGGTYGGRRRIPTFPTGITSAGDFENAQAYVVHSERRDIEDSPNKILIVQTCPIPRIRYEFPEVTFQFPALISINTDTVATFLTLVNGKLPLRVGSGFDVRGHRTRRIVGVLLRRYSAGPASTLSNQFKLTSPGAESAFFGQIDANTIYGNLASGATKISISNADGVIEEFAFSTLSGCAPASNSVAGTDDTIATATLPVFYRLSAEQKPWKGNIHVREYLIVAEDRDLIADAQAQRFAPTSESGSSTTQYLFCA